MNIEYETYLRKDIFPCQPHYVDEIIEVYENDERKRIYIINVLEAYIRGELSVYKTYSILMRNVYYWSKRAKENMQYLDDEYEEKMK